MFALKFQFSVFSLPRESLVSFNSIQIDATTPFNQMCLSNAIELSEKLVFYDFYVIQTHVIMVKHLHILSEWNFQLNHDYIPTKSVFQHSKSLHT